MKIVCLLGLFLAACGRDARDSWTPAEVRDAAGEIAVVISPLWSGVDAAPVRSLLKPSSALGVEWGSASFREAAVDFDESDFFGAWGTDEDSDGIPDQGEKAFSKPAGSVLSPHGKIIFRDRNKTDVFGGYSIFTDDFGYALPTGEGFSVFGGAYLDKKASAYRLRLDLLSVSTGENDVREMSVKVQSTLIPDQMERPEFSGRIALLMGEIQYHKNGKTLTMKIASDGLRYSRTCLGDEKFNAGFWTLTAGDEIVRRVFSTDCSARFN